MTTYALIVISNIKVHNMVNFIRWICSLPFVVSMILGPALPYVLVFCAVMFAVGIALNLIP